MAQWYPCDLLSDVCYWTPPYYLKKLIHVTRDSYLENSRKNIWGNLTIKLLDTAFWSQLANNPDGYHDRYRDGVNLVGYDLAVMPMFGKWVHSLFELLVSFNVCFQQSLEARDYWESRKAPRREYVRARFKITGFQTKQICQAHFTFSIRLLARLPDTEKPPASNTSFWNISKERSSSKVGSRPTSPRLIQAFHLYSFLYPFIEYPGA